MNATTDGGFIIAGTTYSYGHGNADGYVIKADANGDTIWTKTFGGLKDDEFKSVIQTSDGNYALTGYTKSYNDTLGDVWAIKINTLGDTLWRKFYGGNKEDFGNQIIQHPVSSDYYVVGGTQSYGVSLSHLNAYSLWLDNSGSYLHQTIDNTSSTFAQFNSIVISTRTPSLVNTISKETVNAFGLQTKVLEMNYTLNYNNATDFGSTVSDELYRIIATKDKGYACIGYTQGYGAVLSDCYFVKLDSNLIGGNYSIVSVNEINDIDLYKIKVYPNPAEQNLIIESKISLSKASIKLFDYTGNEIAIIDKMVSTKENKLDINIEELPNGIYFLSVGGKIEKILIMH